MATNKRYGRGRKGNGKGVGGAPSTNHHLRATFNVPNKTVLDGENLTLNMGNADGVVVGDLQLIHGSVVPGATSSIVSNKLLMEISSAGWDTSAIYGGDLYRDWGLGVVTRVVLPTLGDSAGLYGSFLGWADSTRDVTSDSAVYRLGLDTGYHVTAWSRDTSSGTYDLAWQSTEVIPGSTSFGQAIVLGGYDLSGNPYYPGASKADYHYGCSYLWKNYTSGGSWQLLGKNWTGNQNPVNPSYYVFDPQGELVLNHICVPKRPIPEPLEEVTLVDHFTDTSGNAIEVVTPTYSTGASLAYIDDDDYGGAGISTNSHDLVISGGRLIHTGIVTVGAAWFELGADGYMETRYITQVTDASNYQILELSYRNDETAVPKNYYTIRYTPTTGDLVLAESVSGATATRASSTLGVAFQGDGVELVCSARFDDIHHNVFIAETATNEDGRLYYSGASTAGLDDKTLCAFRIRPGGTPGAGNGFQYFFAQETGSSVSSWDTTIEDIIP